MNVREELVKILNKHNTTIKCAVVNRADWDTDYVTTIIVDEEHTEDDVAMMLLRIDFDPNVAPYGLEIDSLIFLNNGCSVSVVDNGKVFWQYNTGK